jgi:tetratricopeptide (TPR) repeat protein
LVQAGDRQGAATEFEAGLELDPSNAALRNLLDSQIWLTHQDNGFRHEAGGDHLGAAENFAQAIRIAPPSPTLHYLRGIALVLAGDRRGAGSEFKASLKLDPTNAALRNLLDNYSTARAMHARLHLAKLLVRDLWERRERIRTRLRECASDATSRARVWWRIRQITTLVVLGRQGPDFPEPYSSLQTD